MMKIGSILVVFFIFLVENVFAQEIVDDSVQNVGRENADLAISSVMAKLKDPCSAQFKSFTHPDSKYSQYPNNTVCGMVNAKNGFGGYVGFSPFAYQILTKTTVILSSEVLNSVGGELSTMAFRSTSCASALGIDF